MAQLTAPRKTLRRDGRQFVYGVKAGVACFQGGLAILAGGFARPGRAGQGVSDALKAADAATYRAVGIFTESATGGAGDGDVKVNIEAGSFAFNNSASADAITLADVGKDAFIVDDQTVARTSAGGTRPVAGKIEDVDADGVWVTVAAKHQPGSRTWRLQFAISETDTLAPTNAELVSPVTGAISGMTVIVQKDVTTGGDVTALVGVTAVDGLACTIANAATKGTVVSDTPTAGHASTLVAAGQRIQIAPGAPFNGAGAVSGFIEITY